MKLTRNHLLGVMKIVTDILLIFSVFRLIPFFRQTIGNYSVQGKYRESMSSDLIPVIIFTSVTFIDFLEIGITFFILWQLRKIIVMFSSAHPFEPGNISRVVSVGYALFLFSATQIAIIFLSLFVTWQTELWVNWNIQFPFNAVLFFFAGLVVLVIAEIFRLGAEMYNEQKLTV